MAASRVVYSADSMGQCSAGSSVASRETTTAEKTEPSTASKSAARMDIDWVVQRVALSEYLKAVLSVNEMVVTMAVSMVGQMVSLAATRAAKTE